MMIEQDVIKEFLHTKSDGYLFHRERSDLEFKEQFNFAGLAEYFKDFAAFANTQGGYLIFGIQNAPRIPSGMSKKSIDMFEKIDQEQISGHLNETFSPAIDWERAVITIKRKSYGVFYIYPARSKPVIAKKDEGKDLVIKNGEIYYRYAGRTQKIEYPELEAIINSRISQSNQQWMDLMGRIGKVGPANAAILDTEKGVIEKNENSILVLDDELTKKIKFIREGEFSEKRGAATLRLVGDVQPIDKVEVTRIMHSKLTDEYPYSYRQIEDLVKQAVTNVKINKIQEIVRQNNMKENRTYCAYNFRNKEQEERYKRDGTLPTAIPTIYNDAALQFIINQLQK